MTRYAGIVALAMSVLVWGPGAAAQPTANSLTGTWRLVEYSNVRDGKVVRAFGDKPLGIFIYAASGYVSIHLLHNPLPQRFDDLNLPSAQQDVLEVRSYTGYFGTYEVDLKRSVVTHRVQGGTLLGYIGTAQERPFRLEGDKLIIGDGKSWSRVLERVPDK
jgi:hypothetical protein